QQPKNKRNINVNKFPHDLANKYPPQAFAFFTRIAQYSASYSLRARRIYVWSRFSCGENQIIRYLNPGTAVYRTVVKRDIIKRNQGIHLLGVPLPYNKA